MTSHFDLQTITIDILPNVSRSKANQTMKLFFKNHAENEAERQVSDLFLFFKKALYTVIASGLQLNFNIFS